MSRPFLVVQISDPHIGADWGTGDPLAMLAAAVETVRELDVEPDAVLVTGDLADHADDAEYEQLRELVAPLGAPLFAVAGNHDDRSALRRQFDLPGRDGEAVQYTADLSHLRLVVLDSTRPGYARGELDSARLAWLDAALAAAPDTPTLLALHHAPLSTGIPAMDELGLPTSDRQALAAVIERHPQVWRIVAGHMHRTITAALAGRAVLAVPSTYTQARLTFRSQHIELTAEPAGFAVHAVVDGALTSHIQPVR